MPTSPPPPTPNLDADTVAGFGREWMSFDQSALEESELRKIFDQYFALFPWQRLPAAAVGFDLGCGSGRWARLVAERVGDNGRPAYLSSIAAAALEAHGSRHLCAP